MGDGRRGNDRFLFIDLLNNPFHRLGVDPTATSQQIVCAFEAAVKSVSSPSVLIPERDTILDLRRRLTLELAYPIDSAPDEVATIYRVLSQEL